MKKKIIFRGTATALVTPFCEGRVDFDALSRIIEDQIACGADALVVGGTTGEAATLTDGERYSIFSFAKERVGGRVPLVFGTGTNDTSLAIRHTREAERIGCDGVLLVTPYYNKGTEEGIFRHYLTVSDATNLPIILYNVPSRTGVNLGFSLLERLSRIENIVAIKEASDSAERLVRLAGFGEELGLYAGSDTEIYPCLSLGGLGVISAVSNALPKETSKITLAYSDGRQTDSLLAQLRILPAVRALFLETSPAPLKYALSLLGLSSPEVRLPLAEVRESTKREIEKALTELGKWEIEG